jgi:hypothetical protein
MQPAYNLLSLQLLVVALSEYSQRSERLARIAW